MAILLCTFVLQLGGDLEAANSGLDISAEWLLAKGEAPLTEAQLARLRGYRFERHQYIVGYYTDYINTTPLRIGLSAGMAAVGLLGGLVSLLMASVDASNPSLGVGGFDASLGLLSLTIGASGLLSLALIFPMDEFQRRAYAKYWAWVDGSDNLIDGRAPDAAYNDLWLFEENQWVISGAVYLGSAAVFTPLTYLIFFGVAQLSGGFSPDLIAPAILVSTVPLLLFGIPGMLMVALPQAEIARKNALIKEDADVTAGSPLSFQFTGSGFALRW